jgi:hypothetical protein
VEAVSRGGLVESIVAMLWIPLIVKWNIVMKRIWYVIKDVWCVIRNPEIVCPFRGSQNVVIFEVFIMPML